MKTAERWLRKQKESLDTFEAMDEYAKYYHSKKKHDCHGKGFNVKDNVIYCRECNEPLFEIIGYKNQKQL
jgi:hypothetical protein